MRFMINLGQEYVLEALVIIQFENCYHPIYITKPWISEYKKQ